MRNDWQDLYKAAVLELNPQELPLRIDAAEKAIRQRIAQLPLDDSSSPAERLVLEDAVRLLHMLGNIRTSDDFVPSRTGVPS
jgi:hypothetical protein